MTRLSDALAWAAAAVPGDYLVTYEGWEAFSGTSDVDTIADGNRCGFSDPDLAAIHAELQKRQLYLDRDDRGLYARGA